MRGGRVICARQQQQRPSPTWNFTRCPFWVAHFERLKVPKLNTGLIVLLWVLGKKEKKKKKRNNLKAKFGAMCGSYLDCTEVP